jgi:hypothetical protein
MVKEEPDKLHLEYQSLQTKTEDDCSIEKSMESRLQEFNYKYEKTLAQKM